jgi:hypothetical protein
LKAISEIKPEDGMADQQVTSRTVKEPSYLDAIVPLVTLTVLIGSSVFLFGINAINGPMQVALILCSTVASSSFSRMDILRMPSLKRKRRRFHRSPPQSLFCLPWVR